ncbi:MAG: HAMP domain-containing histidine kinase [Lachnospiraceae bacterium]|nr:HAMP domain-containing histidine kinase [Lachnospiraceae bacterium]
MINRLFSKFILTYAALALIGFFVIATLGSVLVERTLVENRATQYYRQAGLLSDVCADTLSSRTKTLDNLFNELTVIAKGSSADIRIIDTAGREIINTASSLKTEEPDRIPGFDFANFGPGYYEIGTFFSMYESDHLCVLVPLTEQLRTTGYIAICGSMAPLWAERDRVLRNIYTVSAVIFVLSLFVLFLLFFTVISPLRKITSGVKEFASGNLAHRISVPFQDEMGYLADSMNYMADELKKTSDYQRIFISNVSHDFRSPLTSIKGFTEAMMDGTIPPEMHERYLGIIAGEVERLEKLTSGILSLNDMDQSKVILNQSVFDINEVLKKTAAVFEGSCRKKKISIDLVLSGDHLPVKADREKIEQVIYNLLDNAIKFSGRDSTIRLETSERFGKCYVSVKDEGCGIPAGELTSVWDRFYKGDSSRGKDRRGTGLGLSIAKEIISAHGQNISVISTEGVGTEFYFTLNIVEE